MTERTNTELIAQLQRAHRMSVSDATDPDAHTLWGDAATALEELTARLDDVGRAHIDCHTQRDALTARIESAIATGDRVWKPGDTSLSFDWYDIRDILDDDLADAAHQLRLHEAHVVEKLARRYPTITRDMVSRGSVRDWILEQAEQIRKGSA